MSSYTTRGAEGLDRRGFTLDEIERMLAGGILDPDEKFEVIDGEIVPMNAQNLPHMRWRMRLYTALAPFVPAGAESIIEATLILRDRPLSTFEVDVLVFRLPRGEKKIRPKHVLLAIEVADTSRERDLNVKAPRYAAAGVSELWVVDLEARLTRVHRAPGETGYGDVQDFAFAAPLSALFAPDMSVRLNDLDPDA